MPEELLSVAQASALLGISAKTVYDHVYNGQLGSTKIFGSRKIKRSTIDAIIQAGENQAGQLPRIAKKGRGRPRKQPRLVQAPQMPTQVAPAAPESTPAALKFHPGWPSVRQAK